MNINEDDETSFDRSSAVSVLLSHVLKINYYDIEIHNNFKDIINILHKCLKN